MGMRQLIEERMKKEPSRKQIGLYLRQDQIERLTAFVKAIEKASGQKISRNSIIEDAIDVLLAEGEEILRRRS